MTEVDAVAHPGRGGAAAERSGGAGAAEPPRRASRAARQPREVAPLGVPIDPLGWPTRPFLAFASWLARYHRHRVVHLERLSRLFAEGRRVLLVGNHALDIVDPLLLLATVYRRLGRVPHFVGHENGWFRVPFLRDVAARYQVIPSRRPEETVAALRRDGFVMLYPGANREAALRSYRDEPYRLKWEGRLGFLRVALEADAEILFVAAVGCDEAYYQSRLPTSRAILALANAGDGDRYRGARLGFGLLGPHLVPGFLPLPVRLTHLLSRRLDLGDRERARRDPAALAELHARVWGECQSFLDAAVRQRGRHSDALDRAVRGAQGLLARLGV
jgi:1-acyl-sn-glycerol-3-phosphate acyltransferase